MRITSALLGALVGFQVGVAQSTTVQEKADKISLFVGIVPGSNRDLVEPQRERLRNKIVQCANRTGIVSVGMSNFLLHPQMEINEIARVEAMKVMYTAKCEVVLAIARTDYRNFPGQSFGTTSIPVIGSGADSVQAINNAIQQIKTDDPRISKFVLETKARIMDYYTKNCDEVIMEARRHYELQQHDLSIGLLFSVPPAAPCYDEARKMSMTVYKEVLKDECEEQLLQLRSVLVVAKGEGGTQRHAEALKLIQAMNPAADCYQEAYGMMSKLEDDLDEQRRVEWNMERTRMQNEAEVQKEAYRAMAQMSAKADPMVVVTNVLPR